MSEQGVQIRQINRKLDDIQKTLQKLAVQDEQIQQLQRDQGVLWSKVNELISPKGVLASVQNHQAGCPRHQLKYLWMVVVPMGITQIAIAIKIITG